MRIFSQSIQSLSYITISLIAIALPSAAQIQEDTTLPNNSIVTDVGGGVQEITEGTRPNNGSNLFHSFSQFSLNSGETAHFINPSTIENIISRVTGGSISNINGLIKANYSANLFLINPNGIVFGENARLEIGGSFIGSTANSIKFADGTEFSAINPQAKPLLTISVPLGLQYGTNPGSITINGQGNTLIFAPPLIGISGDGLQVEPGQTLALVGGEVTITGGNLRAEGGRVELGSVEEGMVRLTQTNPGWALSYEDVENFQDISLSQAAGIDTAGSTGGNIQLQGERITITDGSLIVNTTLGSGNGRALIINASESVEVSGTNPNPNTPFESSFLIPGTTGTGTGGDVTINTKRLLLQNGGEIFSPTFSDSDSGKLTVNASESIELVGESENLNFPTGLFSNAQQGTGSAGSVTINTRQLTIRDGALVNTGTFSNGRGGDLIVDVSDFIELNGTSVGGIASGLFANAISGQGDGGNITITTNKLTIRDGAQIASGTLTDGRGGSLTVNASDFVELIGTSDATSSGLFANAFSGNGNGGSINIDTPKLIVRDGALISISNFQSQGQGIPGSGVLGDITIISPNIQLRRQGNITTNANTVTGGNIIIDTETLVALENSDITANAQAGPGGRITINAQAIFGTEFREQLTSESDITATSELGPQFSGIVEINTPDVDTSSGLVELPNSIVDVEGLIAQNACEKEQEGNSTFVVTGRGGLPPNPNDPLTDDSVLVDWASPDSQEEEQNLSQNREDYPISKSFFSLPNRIVKATGWKVAPDGTIILIAEVPQITLYNFGLTHPGCRL